MKRLFLLIALIIAFSAEGFSQRKTTSIKGYYRKDGTYVRPHTRTYNGSGSSSYSSSYNTSKTPDSTSSLPEGVSKSTNVSGNTVIAPITTLKFTKTETSSRGSITLPSKTTNISKSPSSNINKTTVNSINIKSEEFPQSDAEDKQILNSQNDEILIYLSVLRYNGDVIDICPVSRDNNGDWDFSQLKHKIKNSKLTRQDQILLQYGYDWNLTNDVLSKSFTSDTNSYKSMPSFLSRSIEALRLNQPQP